MDLVCRSLSRRERIVDEPPTRKVAHVNMYKGDASLTSHTIQLQESWEIIAVHAQW